MRWLSILLVLLPAFYTFSYAKYSWKNNNKPAAWGASLLAIVSIALPVMLLIIR
ncbi:MAG: hypothetical protein GX154_05625 [Clostridiales bacterium]|nr:hypothetical protein [Clostridiales bacterium]